MNGLVLHLLPQLKWKAAEKLIKVLKNCSMCESDSFISDTTGLPMQLYVAHDIVHSCRSLVLNLYEANHGYGCPWCLPMVPLVYMEHRAWKLDLAPSPTEAV